MRIAGWVQLDEIEREAEARLTEYYGHYYGDIHDIAVRCVKELNYDTANTPKRIWLEVDRSLQRAVLPDDFVNYVTIGVEVNGILVALGYNPRMCRPRPDECGAQELGEGGIPSGLKEQWELADGAANPFWFRPWQYAYWPNANDVPHMYGHGGGWNQRGYYRIEKHGGWIDFNPAFNWDHVLLEYISNGFAPGSTTQVPEMMSEAIICYCLWKFFGKKKITETGRRFQELGQLEADYFQQWVVQKRKAAQRQTNNSLYEITAAKRRSFGPHIKL